MRKKQSAIWIVSLFTAALSSILAQTALAHPHAGGIVVRSDNTVLVGDILGSRLLVIEPSGQWREIRGVGGVRELEQTADGTLYGVSQSQGLGLWKLSASEKPEPLLPDFQGLFALGDDGAVFLAAADEQDRRPTLEIQRANGQRSKLASLEQIEALFYHDQAILVTDGSAVRSVSLDGTIETLANDAGRGLYGLTWGPSGPIVTVYESREVVELARDGTRRVLLSSEPPWAPTDVTIHDGVLYVVELAQHPCCWKGPRVRRLVLDATPETLLVIDDQSHSHIMPWDRPLHWLIGVVALATASLLGVAIAVRRFRRSRRWKAATNEDAWAS